MCLFCVRPGREFLTTLSRILQIPHLGGRFLRVPFARLVERAVEKDTIGSAADRINKCVLCGRRGTVNYHPVLNL